MSESLEKRLQNPSDPLSVYAYGWFRETSLKRKKHKTKRKLRKDKSQRPSKSKK